MLGILVVTHGNVAESLLKTAGQIMGQCENMDSYCLDWDDDLTHAKAELQAKIDEIDLGDGVLILTDMFGGTPTNISLAFHEPGRVEILTGVNLPMIMKAMTLPDEITLESAALMVKEQSKKSIYLASDLL